MAGRRVFATRSVPHSPAQPCERINVLSRKRSMVSFAVALAAAGAVITSGAPGTAGPLPDVAAAQPGPTYVYKVHAPLGEQSRDLLGRGFDVLEQREGDSLFVLGGEGEATRLREAGFTAV